MKQIGAAFVLAFLCLSYINLPAHPQQDRNELSAYNEPPSRMRGVIEKFNEDYGSLNRFYTSPTSPNRAARMRQLYSGELALLDRLDFDKLNHDEQVDYI